MKQLTKIKEHTTTSTTTTSFTTTESTTSAISTNITTNLNLNNVNASQLNDILSNAVGSITGCLLKCSNKGFCHYDSDTKQIGCTCNQYFTGSSCEHDIRPCSSYPCLYNGNCTNVFSQNLTSFTCECDNMYYGKYCENQKDLCQNSSCVQSQSYCKVVGSSATCVCFGGYIGVNCEEKSRSLETRNKIVSVTSILAILILVLFCCLIVFMDFLKYHVMKNNSSIYQTKESNLVLKENIAYLAL